MATRKEINTPIGKYTRVSDNYYTGGDGQPWHQNYSALDIGDLGFSVGSYGNPSAPTYNADAFLPGENILGQYIPNFDRNINTPVGNVELESNYDIPNSLSASITPNARTNYYIQALANLLRGR
jgi:hypothetical protein